MGGDGARGKDWHVGITCVLQTQFSSFRLRQAEIAIFLFINVKMLTIFGNLTFMSMKNFMLNRAQHEKSFITSRSECFR